jgi:cyclophilin family peptidyl-prolyl cis-trans isomerase/HEAT repeat protein
LRRIVLGIIGSLSLAATAAAQVSNRAPNQREVRLWARLLSMTDSRAYDPVVVDSALNSAWAPLRAAGALGIGQVGAPAGLPGAPRLRALLRDADVTVASNAAYALGLLVDSMSVPALAAALDDRPRVAREAAWALGEIGAPARAAILAGLAKPGEDDARMIQLLLAAAKLRPVPVAEIRPYLRMDDRASVMWAAAYSIARFRAPAGVRDLIALATRPEFVRVSDAESRVGVGSANVATPVGMRTADAYVLNPAGRQRARAEIARALSLQAAGDSLGDLAVSILLRLAGDTHPHVRINAVRSLATYGMRARNPVIAATQDVDANVRIAAAQSIGTVLDSTTSAWLPLWQRDTSMMYRSSLLASAARAGARLPALTDWMSHAGWQFRLAALNAAGSSRDTAVVARAARSMVRDADGRVRASAYGFLAGNDTTPPARDVHDALIAGLADRDFYARATVIGNLGRHARASDVPAVLSAYSLSLRDSSNDARIAAMQYVAEAWKKDSAGFSNELRRRLSDLAPSSDPLVRAPVDSVSIMRAWSSARGNPRALSWYQNVVRTYVVPAARGQTQRATIRTRRGDVVLELFGADAPITVRNFMNLARSGYYRGTGFHRVVPNFVAQDGDPRGDGNGGPGYSIRDEMNPRRYERGALGMALSGPDTGGSQYFITHSPQPHLDGHYTVFGRVLSGYGALDAIIQGDRILSIVVR